MNSELNYNRFNHNLDQNESIYYEASMTGIFYNYIRLDNKPHDDCFRNIVEKLKKTLKIYFLCHTQWPIQMWFLS